ncbi:hypothetical protein ABPG72_012676 [Tetrahymena utriculariae]
MKQVNLTSKQGKYIQETCNLNGQYNDKSQYNSQICFINQNNKSESFQLAFQNKNLINNSCFLSINFDAFYYEINNRYLLQYMFYPKLISVEINLNQNCSRQINFKYLSEIFSRFQNLHKISIFLSRDSNMNQNSFEELSGILKQNNQIEYFTLSIESYNIDNLKHLSELCSAIESFSKLVKLKLVIKSQKNVINKQGIQIIKNSLQKLKNLRSINLYLSSSIDNLNFNLQLSKLISSLSQIKKFDLLIDFDKKNQLASHEGVVSIFKSFSQLVNLQNLRFSMKNICVNPIILEECFNLLPPLKKLAFYTKYSLIENQFSQSSCFKKLFPCFIQKVNSKSKQKSINIFKRLSQLENLSFCLQDINDESLIALGLGLKSLKMVKYLSVFINPQSQIYKKELQSKSSNLLYDFYEDYILKERIESELGICCFAQGLSVLSQLKTLKFQIEQIKIKKQGLEALKQCFFSLTNLSNLYIKLGSDFSGQSNFLTKVMQGVKNITNLKMLQLEVESFIFSTQNTEGLVQAFEKMLNLESISLSFTKSLYYMHEDNKVSCLADIFKNLQNLTSIKLRINYPQSAQMISQQLLSHIKKAKIIYFEIQDTMSNKNDILTFVQNIIQNQQMQYLFYNLQSDKELQQIFQKCFKREFHKKLKFLKRLVKYSYKK